MPARNPEPRLAQHLAAPFARPGYPAQPLSFRLLPDGGMVVICADGRKLWFTLEEVNQARAELNMQPLPPPPVKPAPPEERPNPAYSSRPSGGSRDGKSEMIVLPPDLKHLEKKIHDQSDRN